MKRQQGQMVLSTRSRPCAQSQVSEHGRYVWRPCPHAVHGRSCDKWSVLVSTVSHMVLPPTAVLVFRDVLLVTSRLPPHDAAQARTRAKCLILGHE